MNLHIPPMLNVNIPSLAHSLPIPAIAACFMSWLAWWFLWYDWGTLTMRESGTIFHMYKMYRLLLIGGDDNDEEEEE